MYGEGLTPLTYRVLRCGHAKDRDDRDRLRMREMWAPLGASLRQAAEGLPRVQAGELGCGAEGREMSKRSELEALTARAETAIGLLVAVADDADSLADEWEETADNQEEHFPSKAETARETAEAIREWAQTVRDDAEGIELEVSLP